MSEPKLTIPSAAEEGRSVPGRRVVVSGGVVKAGNDNGVVQSVSVLSGFPAEWIAELREELGGGKYRQGAEVRPGWNFLVDLQNPKWPYISCADDIGSARYLLTAQKDFLAQDGTAQFTLDESLKIATKNGVHPLNLKAQIIYDNAYRNGSLANIKGGYYWLFDPDVRKLSAQRFELSGPSSVVYSHARNQKHRLRFALEI